MNSLIKNLPLTATREEILENLNYFKLAALNYATNQITSHNSQHLEPKEVKTLTDIVLSLEDTVTSQQSEGKQARTIQKILDKYNDPA